jgi:hypothetical protein
METAGKAVLPIYGTVWATVSYCLCNCVLLFGQLCLTVWATVSYCLCNCVLLFGQLRLTACATVSYCLWKWLARSFPVYGNGFRSCTSENQRLHKELGNFRTEKASLKQELVERRSQLETERASRERIGAKLSAAREKFCSGRHTFGEVSTRRGHNS